MPWGGLQLFAKDLHCTLQDAILCWCRWWSGPWELGDFFSEVFRGKTPSTENWTPFRNCGCLAFLKEFELYDCLAFLIYLFIFGCLMLFVQEFALDRLTDFEKMLEAVSAAWVSHSQLQLHCSSSCPPESGRKFQWNFFQSLVLAFSSTLITNRENWRELPEVESLEVQRWMDRVAPCEVLLHRCMQRRSRSGSFSWRGTWHLFFQKVMWIMPSGSFRT